MTKADGRAPILFDVGGNVGGWTVAAKQSWPGAQVHVFEPSQKHLEQLSRAIDGLKSITINPVALGATAGTATLYKDSEITGLASMTRRDISHVGLSMDITESITVETLDAYCEENKISRIDFMKIDVEGHELDVLSGAKRMIEGNSIGAIQFEFGGCNIDTKTYFRDFFHFFENHHYLLYIIGKSGKLFPIKTYTEYCEQFMTTNYIAIKK